MKDRIKLSESASYLLVNIKQRLNLRGQDDYVPMRIALGRSLQSKKQPIVPENIEISDKEKRSRKEVQLTTFEQNQGLFFQALLSQKYLRKVEEDEYIDLLVQHIEHGLWLIYNETEKVKGYDYLAMILPTQAPTQQEIREQKTISEKNEILSVQIGIDKQSKEPIIYNINTANNPHFGIMGGSGSGKTYFLKHLLTEIRKNSAYETHFIIFDYKDGDIASDVDFVSRANAEVINVKKQALPLNIFANVGVDEKEQKARAERIVEIVKNVEANIGKVQENNLYNAILSAYDSCKNSKTNYPDFRIVKEELELINAKPDSLTSVLRPLVDQHYFAYQSELIYENWTNKTLVIDIHDIERKDLICFFVLNQVHQELKRLGVSPIQLLDDKTKVQKIRTFIVIDEAHYFLDNPKRAKILQNMIRDIRSAGGGVILASQSPDDYDKSEFNFLELLEFPIVLKSTPSSPKFLEQKFSLPTSKAKEMLLELGKMARGEAYLLYNGKVVKAELTK